MNFRHQPLVLRLIILMGGLFLYAVGLILCIQADIGYMPWDVFHKGVSLRTGLSIGNVSILTGAAIVIFNVFMKEKVGIGTILNVFFIGTFMDLILDAGLIPQMTGLIPGIVMMLVGFLFIGFATYFYIAAGFGAGPRDGLMLALMRITGRDVALIRNSIEIVVTIFGFFLGGPVGVGTLLTALTMGFFVKLAFSIFRFDSSKVQHQYLKLPYLKKIKKAEESNLAE